MADDMMAIVAIGLPETTKLLIRSKLAPIAVEFRSPHSVDELIQMVSSKVANVGCVLLDSDTQNDKGLAFFKAVRSINKILPIVVLSSDADKNYYIQAIRLGVSSFIVKPFKDDSLRNKLLECYHSQCDKSVEQITFNLEKYLLGEFHKAEKGRFSLSFMFAAVMLDDPEEQGNVMSHTYYMNLLYDTLRQLFWDTDAFIRLNSRYCFGVFPFCGKDNMDILTTKIHTAFGALYSTKHVPTYVRLVLAFSSYPEDSSRFLDLQKTLADRVRVLMGDKQLEWFI